MEQDILLIQETVYTQENQTSRRSNLKYERSWNVGRKKQRSYTFEPEIVFVLCIAHAIENLKYYHMLETLFDSSSSSSSY